MQWGLGAVGNALWKGARLKDVLSRVSVRPETIEFVLNGADGPVLDGTPDFIKSIPLSKALDENTLIAYEMNGAPLPLQWLSGSPRPARLDGDLLDEASRFNRGGDEALRRLLDEERLSHPERKIPDR
jgi:hypothetical protein